MSREMKDRVGKLPLELVDPEFIEGVARAMADGERKYVRGSWRDQVESPVDTYYGAAQRHLNAYRRGEKIAPDSGVHHLEHAAACIMFLLHFERLGLGSEFRAQYDRLKKEAENA